MAFGTWMKKISEKVKSFGQKVKNVAKKAYEGVKKGIDLVEEYAPKVGDFGNAIGGTFGRAISDASGQVRKWTNQTRQFIDPLENN